MLRANSVLRRKNAKSATINSTFYVERLTTRGDIVTEYVEAKSLRVTDGQMYVDGWCHMLPSYRSVPVRRIVRLADDQTHQIVPRDGVAAWLINRSLH